MSKKIIVLNGSPRANGNTSRLLAAFQEGAEGGGNAVTAFHLQSMDIRPCIGCFGGGKNPDSPCVQKDDMDRIYPAYRDADLVVLGSPLYYWTISGQLKCAFDRLFAVAEGEPGMRNPVKECILIMAAEGNGYKETLFWYKNLVKHLGWTNRGTVLAGGVMNPGDIDGTPFVEEARKLGKSLI